MRSQDDAPPSFVAESTLGRLAKWLRLAGCDTLWDRGVPEAGRLRRISQDGRRIVLTRTRSVYRALAADAAIFIRHNHIRRQLRQVVHALSLQPRHLRPLTLCARCNQRLVAADRDQQRHRMPEHVWHLHQEVRQCPRCRKLYWPGTHANAMRDFMDGWFQEDGATP